MIKAGNASVEVRHFTTATAAQTDKLSGLPVSPNVFWLNRFQRGNAIYSGSAVVHVAFASRFAARIFGAQLKYSPWRYAMSKSQDTKKDKKKAPQKTVAEKKLAKREKKNNK